MTKALWEKFARMSADEADDDAIQADIVSLDEILNHIDEAEGRNDALRRYVICLRNLQRENDRSVVCNNDAAIDAAQAAVTEAFQELIEAQHALDRAARAEN